MQKLIKKGKNLVMTIAEFINASISFIEHHQNYIYPFVIFITFCESLAFISLLVPATVLLVALSIFLGDSNISFIPVWLCATFGAFLGDWVSYFLGFHYKDKIPHIWPFKNRPSLLKKGHDFFEKWGVWSIFIGRFFSPIRAIITLIAGIYYMDKKLFFIANLISSFIWSFSLIAPGALGIPSLLSIFN